MVAVLHPTAPLRPRGLLDGAVDALREAEAAERVRTVTPIEDGSGLVVRGEGGLLTPAMGDGERGSGVRWVTGHAEVWRVDALRRAAAGGAAPAGVGVEVPRECAVEVTANDALDRAQRAIDRFGHALDLAHPRALARIANEASVLGGGGLSGGGSDTGGRRVDAA
jgi:hypothetical protein